MLTAPHYPDGMKRALAFAAAGIAAATATIAATAATPATLRVQLVDERGVPVRDAVVDLTPKGGWNGPVSIPGRAAMAQRDLQFVPGTLIVAKGDMVAFPNLDKVRHHIYSFSKAAKFEIDLYGREQTRSRNFPIAGAVSLGCNIHDNMRGYVKVVDTPFAGKTDHNGMITLSGIPTGEVTISAWHPRMKSSDNTSYKAAMIAGGAQSRKLAVRMR